jgi:hypothetical protein
MEVGCPNPPLPVTAKGTLGTNWTELEAGVPETACGFVIVPAIARPTNNAARAKCVLNLFILVSPFD